MSGQRAASVDAHRRYGHARGHRTLRETGRRGFERAGGLVGPRQCRPPVPRGPRKCRRRPTLDRRDSGGHVVAQRNGPIPRRPTLVSGQTERPSRRVETRPTILATQFSLQSVGLID